MELTITLEDTSKRAALFGAGDRHLRLIKGTLGVQIAAREAAIRLSGPTRAVGQAAAVLEQMQRHLRDRQELNDELVAEAIAQATRRDDPQAYNGEAIEVYAQQAVSPKTAGQKAYVEGIRQNDLVFCVGPAGTGKTYLAVAMAVSMLKRGSIQRIILVRPAVEAGEKLGYLPGDMQAKVNPYLRPLFDAMADMMSFEQTKRLIAGDVIEVAPLAFMRGRTLNNSAIVLDEAQNTTCAQMLMFLTRLGHHSKMIVTGDDSQVDLERPDSSGLIDAMRRLQGLEGISFIRLDRLDIVRHRLVQNIVNAYGNGKM